MCSLGLVIKQFLDRIVFVVKKIRLRAGQSDQKIFREVDTLSRLNHRYIVRYYTTWIETSDHVSTETSAVGSSAGTSVPTGQTGSTTEEEESDPFAINFDELDAYNNTPSQASFPAITFTRSGTPRSGSDEGSGSDGTGTASEEGEEEVSPATGRAPNHLTRRAATPVPAVSRTLYIQMEFVERQTLREVSCNPSF